MHKLGHLNIYMFIKYGLPKYLRTGNVGHAPKYLHIYKVGHLNTYMLVAYFETRLRGR